MLVVLSLYLKCEYHTYHRVLPKVSSSKASQRIKTVSEKVFPTKENKTPYTLTVLFSQAIIKIMPSNTRKKWQTRNMSANPESLLAETDSNDTITPVCALHSNFDYF